MNQIQILIDMMQLSKIEEFKYNMNYLLNKNPLIVKTLDYCIYEGQKEDHLLTLTGLFNILLERHPVESTALLKHLQVKKYLEKSQEKE